MKIYNYILYSFIFLLSVFFFVFDYNANYLFGINLILCFMICFKSKLSIFSLKELLITYVMISIFFQYNTNTSYGILQLCGTNLFYLEMNLIVLLYNILIFFFLSKTKVLSFEKNMLVKVRENNHQIAFLFSLFAIVFTIIAFPRFGYVSNATDRFNALLPGKAWNHFVVACLVLAMPSFNKSKFTKFSFAFCIFWFLINGERVDMIGILACLIIYLFANKFVQAEQKKKMKYYIQIGIFSLVVCFGMLAVGSIRSDSESFVPKSIVRSVLVQSTASDIGYTFHSSIRYVKENGYLYGKTYPYYIKKIIPFTSNVGGAADILIEKYNSPGGIYLLSEPYMNFGIIGLIIFTVIELFVLYLIIKHDSNYAFILYLFLLATVFRTSWYGLEYIEKGVIYILPFLYFSFQFINKKVINRANK